MAATHFLSFSDPNAGGVDLQTPTQARAGKKYLTVIDFISLNITNGAAPGPCGIIVLTPDGHPLVQLSSDLAVGATDSIHAEWTTGLPGFRVDTATTATGSGVTGSFYAEQGETLGASSKLSVQGIVTDTDVSMIGTIGYHYEYRSRNR